MTFFHKVLLHLSVRLYSCDFDREHTCSFFGKTVVFSSIFLSFLTDIVRHVPETLAKKLFNFMKNQQMEIVDSEVTGDPRPAPEGK